MKAATSEGQKVLTFARALADLLEKHQAFLYADGGRRITAEIEGVEITLSDGAVTAGCVRRSVKAATN